MLDRASQLPHHKCFRKPFPVLAGALLIPVHMLGALPLLSVLALDTFQFHVKVVCSPADHLPHKVDVSRGFGHPPIIPIHVAGPAGGPFGIQGEGHRFRVCFGRDPLQVLRGACQR